MGILTWIIFGLIAGAIAKFIMPGNQGMGWLMTIILGIVGAFVGGWIGSMLGWGTVTNSTLRVCSLPLEEPCWFSGFTVWLLEELKSQIQN